MKKIVLISALFIVCISILIGKDYSVSFLTQSSSGHPSFTVNGQIIRDGDDKIYTISDSDKIYCDYDNNGLFEVISVRIRIYHDGKYDPDQEIIRPLIKESDNSSYFTIGDIGGSNKDLSIECIQKYKTTNLNLTALVDEEKREIGTWYINGKESIAPHQVSVVDGYTVRFFFDSSQYYLISANPAEKVLTTSEDTVIFMNEKQSGSTVDYSVSLRPYTSIALNKKNIIDVEYNNKSIIDTIESIKFRSNDVITVVSRRDYSVDKSCGLDIVDTSYEDNTRKTKLRIPSESTQYSYTINMVKQDEASLILKLTTVSIDSEKIASISQKINVSLTDRLNEPVKIDELFKNGYMEVKIQEDDLIKLFIEKPAKNYKVSFRIKSDIPSNQIYIEDIQQNLIETFKYTDAKEINELEIVITEGFRFIPTSIINADNIGIVSYYYARQPITESIFIPYSKAVTIEINDTPEYRKLEIKGKQLEKTADNVIKKEVIIDEETDMSDFEISAKTIPYFIINPDDYPFEHGNVSLQKKKSYGTYTTITGDTLVCEGDTIKLSIISIDEGYTFSSDIMPEKSDFSSLNDFNNWINRFRFVRDEEAYMYVPNLPQPLFGNVTYKYESGAEVNVGDYVKKEQTVICYYQSPVGFMCTNEGKNKNVTITAKDLYSYKPEEYIERDDNKPELTITLDKPVFTSINYSVEAKYMDSSNENPLIDSLTNDNPQLPYQKISTVSPIVLEFHGINQKGKAIQITGTTTSIDKKTQNFEARISNEEDIYIISDHMSTTAGCPVSKISIKIKMIDASLFENPSLDNAVIEVYKSDTKSKVKVEAGDVIIKDEKVTVTIVPKEGYYIEGTENKDYSFTFNSKYSQIEEIIAKHIPKKLIAVFLPDYASKGLTYTKSNEPIFAGWNYFMPGEVIYFSIEQEMKDKYQVMNWIDFWTNSSKYCHKIEESDEQRELTLLDFNCMEKKTK